MSRARLRMVAVMLAAAGAAVTLRAGQVMLLEHSDWQSRARRQQERVLEVPSLRGRILSADGYVLAASVDRVAVQADRELLGYPELFASAAAPLLGVGADDLERRLTRGPRAVWLAQRVEEDLAERLHELAPGAVVLVPDSERVYPLGQLGAPLVGFVGREELRTVGRSGLEHHHDERLAGEPQRFLAINDAVQRHVRLERLQAGRAGSDLRLTVHARLQAVAERALADAIEATAASHASAVVLDARTGDLLVLASLPSFDPARGGEASPERWRLRPVQDALEPGSTVKPMVAAAALAAGVVRPGERLDCTDRGIRVAGRWIRDHAEPGRYTLDEVVVHSANAGIVRVAERLEPKLLHDAFAGFGFGRRTGVDFPAEAEGMLAPASSWSALSPAGMALGQEITVSPLQMAAAYAAIASDGWLPRPRLLADSFVRPVRTRVLDAALARRLRGMLAAAVEQGTGTQAAVAGYRVAGKTGTAQRAQAGGFDDEHHTAWFAGFLPMPEPRWVVVVAIENPRRDFWASSVAAPVFADIAAGVVTVLGVPPNEPITAAARRESREGSA